MGAVDTTYTFTATDTITSTKMNNIIDQTTMTSDAIIGTTLEVASGKLKVRAAGITSNELAANAVTTNSVENGAITLEKLNSNVIFVPSGAVMAFARSSAPTGWLIANGASISTGGANAALFAAIGYTYGGSGGSFNLPNLQGIFVRGSGSQSIGGISYSGVLGTIQNATRVLKDWYNSSAFPARDVISNGGMQNAPSDWESGTDVNVYSATETRFGGSAGTTGVMKTDAMRVRPANIALLYCIKL